MKITNPDPQADEKKEPRVFWKRVDFWVILILLAAASVFYRDSWYDIWEGIQQITGREMTYSILLSAVAYLLEGMTIACMMSTVLHSFPVRRGTVIAYLCEFYRLITLGNGSGLAEIYYLRKSGIETGTATVLTMIQYICKRTTIMILGGVGFAVLLGGRDTRMLCGEYAGFMAVGCVVSLAVITVILCIAVSSKIAGLLNKCADWMAGKFPSWAERLHVWKEQVTLLNQSGKMILAQKRKMTCAILLQTGKLLLFYGIPVYLLQNGLSLYGELPGWKECFSLMAVVYMLSGVIPAPSGVGSLEFVFLLFFSRFAGAQTVVPAILVFRFVTWVLPFVAGGVMRIFTERKTSTYVSDSGGS